MTESQSRCSKWRTGRQFKYDLLGGLLELCAFGLGCAAIGFEPIPLGMSYGVGAVVCFLAGLAVICPNRIRSDMDEENRRPSEEEMMELTRLTQRIQAAQRYREQEAAQTPMLQ